MKKLIVFSVLVTAFFFNGCGLVGLMGTQSQYEKKIPAEYDLTKQKGQKILILVEQPGWLSARTNLRYYLTKAVGESLTEKVKIPSKYVISYKELSEFRSEKSDFSLLSPAAVGRALGADIVLLVTIEDYQLNDVADSGYYNGFLGTRNFLFEAESGERVWPEIEDGKRVSVGFEVAEKGQEDAVDRLVNACAYCTTRYFYDCPKYKFRIFDETKDTGWE